ncbi:spore protease YyaC [Effusibacillus dendaii]|uniref:Spore protease YyaC n=1 Tax=Effusibacillus dendaii TaxID=2743772 RepID=A0A7I8DBM7_9BACL|nr:spore protease YyaC [Effusibacillus dendaii]BCJ87495.1 hypothetical protein skT53_24800 [Effusibacillus dendaii]
MPAFKINHAIPDASDQIRNQIINLLSETVSNRPLLVVCIGTDRSTGDSLGPLAGSRLQTLLPDGDCPVYGTLENPVHAVNLADTLQSIQQLYHNPCIIAIDACLGQLNSVGMISVASGPLRPGAGVNKNLPEIGDLHITGIVNVGGFMEYFVLQNTRLSLVMKMAECIAQTLAETLPVFLPAANRKDTRYKPVRFETNYLR